MKKMMNVAFYITNNKIKDIDCRNLKDGNPGIGGTYYAMLMLVYLLSDRKVHDKCFYLFAESVRHLPGCVRSVETPDLLSLSSNVKKYSIDILVVNKIGPESLNDAFFKALKNDIVKIIIWDHCFIPYRTLCKYANNSKVARIVAVGKEQLYTWCDHSAFKKSTYIYNICNYPKLDVKPYDKRSRNVVYIGSIVPLKGLHLLTDIWKKILKEIPDAQLYIIGGGNLYNRQSDLGDLGIADFFYEKRLLKNILDEQGNILESIHFCGILGAEKFEILNEARVGVPNPSGLTETFGFTAIEMQLAGCMVATIKCPGYVDTVYIDNGILYNKTGQLASSIIQLLKKTDHDPKPGINFIQHSFSPDNIIGLWIKLFEDVYNNINEIHSPAGSILKLTKWKLVNRKLQVFVPFLPSLMLYESVWRVVKYLFLKVYHISDTLNKIYRRKIRSL